MSQTLLWIQKNSCNGLYKGSDMVDLDFDLLFPGISKKYSLSPSVSARGSVNFSSLSFLGWWQIIYACHKC